MQQTAKSVEAEKPKTRRLSPDELCDVAQRMIDSKDPAEVARLKAEFVRGFYGDEPPHA